MTKDEAQRLLRDYDGFGGLEGGTERVDRRQQGTRQVFFPQEPFGNDLHITAITPNGKAPGEWGVWTVPGRSNDRF